MTRRDGTSRGAIRSLAVKTAAVLLLTVTVFVTALTGVGVGLSAVYGIYDGEGMDQIRSELTESYLSDIAYDMVQCYLLDAAGMDTWMRSQPGLYYRVEDANGTILAGNDPEESGLAHLEWVLDVPDDKSGAPTEDGESGLTDAGKPTVIHLWASSDAMRGWYRGLYRTLTVLSRYPITNAAVCLTGLIVSICLLVFLLGAAGRHPGEDGVRESPLDRIPFDLFTLLVGVLELIMLLLLNAAVGSSGSGTLFLPLVLTVIVYIPAMLLLIGYAMSLAVRIKTGTVFRHTLIWIVLSAIGREARRICALIHRVSLVKRTVVSLIVLFAVNLVIGVVLISGGRAYMMLMLILLELVILGIGAFRYALGLHRLQDGVAHLAKGNFDYRVETDGLPGDCRISVENVNCIGKGLSDAVEERIKSEHFRTELITNVSHDIKTPLTSIINYVELIRQLSPTDETLCGYIDVLDRQSTRLKKLIDDLLEASKAASGVLNVTLSPCEVGVLLEQVQGEYAERLRTHDLRLVVQTPAEPLTVLADGRHLGRIFDNLMNNILKYAQPGTRVYLDAMAGLEQSASAGTRQVVVITFRNVSAEPLNIPADELMERFVRGDASRHTEGSGLGLSIVRSLTELQGGTFRLAIDGDLFKARLTFPRCTPEAVREAYAESGPGSGGSR